MTAIPLPTISVVCNYAGCTAITTVVGVGTPAIARAFAAKEGWTHHHDPDHGHEHDHCPDHSQPPKPPQQRKRLRDRIRNLAPRLSMPPVPALSTTTRR
ncbi:hypothetical protein ABZ815_20375 [Nonomuraea sp. NPDC047529]|uniref:hypothetical protein n=1 Tax=Nonomuraea sp. NPDC047529 TaxID=3155623 RepID=UPI0033C3E5A9